MSSNPAGCAGVTIIPQKKKADRCELPGCGKKPLLGSATYSFGHQLEVQKIKDRIRSDKRYQKRKTKQNG